MISVAALPGVTIKYNIQAAMKNRIYKVSSLVSI